MGDVVAVLLVPAEGDPLGLLESGVCGARPPTVEFRVYRYGHTTHGTWLPGAMACDHPGAYETPPEGVTPSSGPVALAHDRFWSYDEGNGIEWHDTEDEARNAAAEALDYARESGDCWPDWVEHICWGEVRGHVVQTASKHRDDYEAENDEAMVSRMERHGWDTIDDYALADVAMCASANEAADFQRRLADAELRVALWSGAPVEGWERRSGLLLRGPRAGARAIVCRWSGDEAWRWSGLRADERVTGGSDPDPLVCLRAAEAWLLEVPRG